MPKPGSCQKVERGMGTCPKGGPSSTPPSQGSKNLKEKKRGVYLVTRALRRKVVMRIDCQCQLKKRKRQVPERTVARKAPGPLDREKTKGRKIISFTIFSLTR